MKRVRYLLLLVVISALVAGGWAAWQTLFTESPTASFHDRLRLPQDVPQWLKTKGGATPDEANIRPGRKRTRSFNPDLLHIGIWLILVDTEV